MKISVKKTSLKSLKEHTLIVPVYQQSSKLELPKNARHLSAELKKLSKDGLYKGSHRQTFLLPGTKNPNVIFVGLGKQGDITLNKIREGLLKAAQGVSCIEPPSLAFHLGSIEGLKGIGTTLLTQAVVESLALPLYTYTAFKEGKPNSGVKSLTIALDSAQDLKDAKSGAQNANILVDACDMVRDLVNAPSNALRPAQYADIAAKMGKKVGLKAKIFKEAELKKLGFGALLGVNRGSDEPPRFVILEHNAGKKNMDTVCLVGKGITFDTGGISLKPPGSMIGMKYDMAGSATVLGIMQSVARMKLPLHVVGLIAITDNMPSGHATVPGDIVKAYNGKTIEILNTDAEGRLILADALSYADKHYKPDLIIDFATLTGACIIALGNAGSAIMGTDQEAMNHLKALGNTTGEKTWQLPIWDELTPETISTIADLRNIGTDRGAGTTKAAAFLKHFIHDDTPWVHFDIAGTASLDKPTYRYAPKGATASCVRLVTEFLNQW